MITRPVLRICLHNSLKAGLRSLVTRSPCASRQQADVSTATSTKDRFLYVHNQDKWSTERLKETLDSIQVLPDFISESEENTLYEEVQQPLRRLRYEKEHWDDAIYLYREIERSQWSPESTSIIDRLRRHSFPNETLLSHVHALDLHKDGHIKPHIDSARYCGHTISGISLLSDCVMRLIHKEEKSEIIDLLLLRRSLYIITDISRYDFTHEILPNETSSFNGQKVVKDRRISIICRDLPRPVAD